MGHFRKVLFPHSQRIEQLQHLQPVLDRTPNHTAMVDLWPTALPELSRPVVKDNEHSTDSAAQRQSTAVQATIMDHIKQLQDSLADDEQLVVYCDDGGERVLVTEIAAPDHYTLILGGVDGEGNATSLIVTLNNI